MSACPNGTDLEVKSRPKLAGHSQTEGKFTYIDGYDASGNPIYKTDDILISVGPNVDLNPSADGLKWEWEYVKAQFEGNAVGGENYPYIKPGQPQIVTKLNNVNGKNPFNYD